jgi:Predicted transcriptional regulators
MKTGTRIKRLRNNKKLTQEELANMVGISRQTIIKYEKNEMIPGIKNLKKIAIALGVDIVYLTNEEKTNISFKNWLKEYEYVPGTFQNRYFTDNTQEENDDSIYELLKSLRELKKLPNKKQIDNEVLKYIYKSFFVQSYVKDLKDDGEKTGLFLLTKDDFFSDLQFIFKEYKKYLDELETKNTRTYIKTNKGHYDFFKQMPPLYHKLPDEIYDPFKSQVLRWMDSLPFEVKIGMYEDAFEKSRKYRTVEFNEETSKWKGAENNGINKSGHN